MLERIKTYRRALHQIPELELCLPQTSAYIKKALKGLPCILTEPIPYSVAAFFDNGKKETIAFRSDMDALPIQEQTQVSFKSKTKGCMHACGHDGHMAMLLGFAHELATYYQALPHNVLLIFQPGEESPGGAELICRTGLLETYHVKAIYAFHLWPNLEQGVIATRKKEMMARSSEINIEITGKSAHAAKYQEGIDALEVATSYIQRVYKMEQAIDTSLYRLLRFGKMTSGTVRNAVSAHTRIEGTLRSFQEDMYWYLRNQLQTIAKEYEEETQVSFQFEFSSGYPAVINDAALCNHILQAIPAIQELPYPEMISEDFSQYQTRVPGVFFFLGTGTGIALHSDMFDFDEAVLLEGIKAYKAISWL